MANDDAIRRLDTGEASENPSGPLLDVDQQEFVDFLTQTLIPDLKRSDPTSGYVKDFTEAVRYIRHPKAKGAAGFVRYLRYVIGPDTAKSGMEATADDLFTAADMIEERMTGNNPETCEGGCCDTCKCVGGCPGGICVECDGCGACCCECPTANASGQLAEAKKKVAALGLTLKHDPETGEYIVKERGSADDSDTSYHTDDLEDAVSTAEKMAADLGPSENAEPSGRGDPASRDPIEEAIEDAILEGMARAFFVSAWANKEEEEGRTYPGEELMDVAPKTPDEAYDAADDLMDEIEETTKRYVSDLFTQAIRDSKLDPSDDSLPSEFGHYLAMQAMGHGVSWEDDHAKLRFKVPSAEFYL